MSETSDVEAAADAPTPRQRLRTRMAVSALIVAALINLYLPLFIIPRFAEIFRDMLGDRPLPAVTTLVVDGKWAFVALACVWLAVAICAVRNRRVQRHVVATCGMIVLQVLFILFALMVPLIKIIHQLSGDR